MTSVSHRALLELFCIASSVIVVRMRDRVSETRPGLSTMIEGGSGSIRRGNVVVLGSLEKVKLAEGAIPCLTKGPRVAPVVPTLVGLAFLPTCRQVKSQGPPTPESHRAASITPECSFCPECKLRTALCDYD